HLRTPYDVLDEIHRTLAPAGRCTVRVPCLGTHAAHADPTHVFLADLKTWRQILAGYFEAVKVASEGVKNRDHKLLVAVNHVLVKVSASTSSRRYGCSPRRAHGRTRSTRGSAGGWR